MRRAGIAGALLVLLAGCGPDGADVTATDGYPWEQPTDDTTVEQARERAEDLVRDTAAHAGLDFDESHWVDPDQPRLSTCDGGAITEDTAFTANVRARIPTDADARQLLDQIEDYWTHQGVGGFTEQMADSPTPSLTGVYDDQRWQLSVLVNTEHDFASISINTPCLPSEEWEAL